jgi:hypothetical protein
MTTGEKSLTDGGDPDKKERKLGALRNGEQEAVEK